MDRQQSIAGNQIINKHHFGIALFEPTNTINMGQIIRSAGVFGAHYVMYQDHAWRPKKKHFQSVCDISKFHRHMPVFEVNDIITSIPFESTLVVIELTEDATCLTEFQHPKQATYVFGSEKYGVSNELLAYGREYGHVVKVPSRRSLNLGACCSVVLYDRYLKSKKELNHGHA